MRLSNHQIPSRRLRARQDRPHISANPNRETPRHRTNRQNPKQNDQPRYQAEQPKPLSFQGPFKIHAVLCLPLNQSAQQELKVNKCQGRIFNTADRVAIGKVISPLSSRPHLRLIDTQVIHLLQIESLKRGRMTWRTSTILRVGKVSFWIGERMNVRPHLVVRTIRTPRRKCRLG